MFWGLIMEPNKRYTQTVEKAFHLSMASLDASTASGGLVQVMICYDNRNYLLCTLQKGSIWQVPLDLNFAEGTKIAFTCNGDGYVHLTGYLIPENEDEGLDELDDFDEEDEEEEDEEVPQLIPIKKRKATNSPPSNEMKQAKKSKIEVEEDEDDDDDESDSDIEDGELATGEDSDDLDGEEDDEDEEDSDEDDDEEDEEEETPVKPPTKKEKQKQKQQTQQNQQNQQNHQQNQSQQNKKEKNKLVNGKDQGKSDKQQEKQKKKDDSKNEDKSEQQQQQKRRTIEGGVQVEDLKVGNGAPAKAGKFVSVYYIGRLKNGKKFDQTQQGEGFKFRLGKGEVIKGWDVGIAGMKVGGKRRITIPPNMAYGAKGSPPVIPPNSQLNFEVELKAIH